MTPFYLSGDLNTILLAVAVLVPLLTGLTMVFLPSAISRRILDLVGTLAVSVPAVVAVILACSFAPADHGYAFLSQTPLGLEAIGANFSLGLNALSLPLFVLTAIVGLATGLYTLGTKAERRGLFWGLILMILGGTLGAFASVDLFYSFLFHEMALLPTLIALAVFGGANRRAVTIEVGLWLLLGSLLMVVGLLLFYFNTSIASFDIILIRERLMNLSISAELHPIIWGFLLGGLAIIVGLWPFYSWVPKLLTTAPTAVSMLHVGALKMFGFYYLLQGFSGWTHIGVLEFHWVGTLLAMAAIILLGVAALAQTDLKRLLSYSTLMHVGTLVMGLIAYTHESVVGLTLLMVGSGLGGALSFLAAGAIDRRVGSLEMTHLSGLRQTSPKMGVFLLMGLMAATGLPAFVSFWGEWGILLGTMRSLPFGFLVILVGLMISATFCVRAANGLLMGSPKPSSIKDLNPLETFAGALLALPLIALMFFPGLITGPLNQTLKFIMPFSL